MGISNIIMHKQGFTFTHTYSSSPAVLFFSFGFHLTAVIPARTSICSQEPNVIAIIETRKFDKVDCGGGAEDMQV